MFCVNKFGRPHAGERVRHNTEDKRRRSCPDGNPAHGRVRVHDEALRSYARRAEQYGREDNAEHAEYWWTVVAAVREGR